MPIAQIFVDSGIVLEPIVSIVKNKKDISRSFYEYKDRNPSNVEFMITSRVKLEVKDVIKKINREIGNLMQDLYNFLKDKDFVSNHIIEMFEDLEVDKIKNETKDDVEWKKRMDHLRSFISWIIDIIRSKKIVSKINKEEFIKEFAIKFQDYLRYISTNLDTELKSYKLYDNDSDICDNLCNFIKDFTTIGNNKDIKHLVDILTYQYIFNKWVIFVSLDYRDIANKIHRNELRQMNIFVCAPNYIESRIEEIKNINQKPIDFLINESDDDYTCVDPLNCNILVFLPYLKYVLTNHLKNCNLIDKNIEYNFGKYPDSLLLCNEIPEKNKNVLISKVIFKEMKPKAFIKVNGDKYIIHLDDNKLIIKENDIVIIKNIKYRLSNYGRLYYKAKIERKLSN